MPHPLSLSKTAHSFDSTDLAEQNATVNVVRIGTMIITLTFGVMGCDDDSSSDDTSGSTGETETSGPTEESTSTSGGGVSTMADGGGVSTTAGEATSDGDGGGTTSSAETTGGDDSTTGGEGSESGDEGSDETGDETTGEDETSGGEAAISFARDIYPRFTASTCLTPGCHNTDPGAAGLNLESVSVAYDELVNVPATSAGFAIDRVEPGDASNSYLPMFASDALVPAGALTNADVTAINAWIDDGANP